MALWFREGIIAQCVLGLFMDLGLFFLGGLLVIQVDAFWNLLWFLVFCSGRTSGHFGWNVLVGLDISQAFLIKWLWNSLLPFPVSILTKDYSLNSPHLAVCEAEYSVYASFWQRNVLKHLSSNKKSIYGLWKNMPDLCIFLRMRLVEMTWSRGSCKTEVDSHSVICLDPLKT